MNGRRERRRRCLRLDASLSAPRVSAAMPRLEKFGAMRSGARALMCICAYVHMRSCAHARHDTASAGVDSKCSMACSAMHSSTETDAGRRVEPRRTANATRDATAGAPPLKAGNP